MKKHFYSRLLDRVDRLKRYKNKPYSLSIKLIWWIIKCCLTPSYWEREKERVCVGGTPRKHFLCGKRI